MSEDRGDGSASEHRPRDCGVAAAVLAQLASAVTALLELDRMQLSAEQSVNVCVEVERARRRLVSVDHANIAHLVESGAAVEVGAASTRALLVGAVRITPGEASARVLAAEQLGPRRALTGEVLEPVFAQVA